MNVPSFTIDTAIPTATINYDISTPTSKNVVATLTGSTKPITVSNNWWSTSYTFTWNGSFSFEFVDSIGNTWTTTATVTWIKSAAEKPLTTTWTNIKDTTKK